MNIPEEATIRPGNVPPGRGCPMGSRGTLRVGHEHDRLSRRLGRLSSATSSL